MFEPICELIINCTTGVFNFVRKILNISGAGRFEFNIGWFEFNIGWFEFNIGWFEFNIGWFEFNIGWFEFN
ncbi:Hypothetical protein HVR_LOCUS169, partial [uncultured virus]